MCTLRRFVLLLLEVGSDASWSAFDSPVIIWHTVTLITRVKKLTFTVLCLWLRQSPRFIIRSCCCSCQTAPTLKSWLYHWSLESNTPKYLGFLCPFNSLGDYTMTPSCLWLSSALLICSSSLHALCFKIRLYHSNIIDLYCHSKSLTSGRHYRLNTFSMILWRMMRLCVSGISKSEKGRCTCVLEETGFALYLIYLRT